MKIYINTDTKKNNIAKYPSHSLCCLYYLLPYSNYTLLFLTFLKKKKHCYFLPKAPLLRGKNHE